VLIKINPGGVEIPGQDLRLIKPALSVEWLKEELEVLDSASQGKLGSFRPDEGWLKNFGQRFFQTVFGKELRLESPLVLDIAPDLRELPWELLHNGERFLVLNPGILRCFTEIPEKSVANSPITDRKAHVTVLLASPLLNADPDETLPIDSKTGLYDPLLNQPSVLDFRKEVQGFTDLEGHPYPYIFDLYRRTQRGTFREQLLNGPDILHFSGHGDRGCLSLETDIATSDIFTSQDLMESGIHPNIRLAVLNGCLTAAALKATAQDGLSMAEAFGQLGVPYVIAMQSSLSTVSGTLLSGHFYRYLAKGKTIAEAVRLSRFTLHEQGPHPWEFAVPILFTAHPEKEEGALVIPVETEEQVDVKLRGSRLTEQREERFAGRRRELVKIAKALDRHSADRGVLLHGAGGMGKTATALEAAHRFGEDFDEVVFAAARRELPSPELSVELKGASIGRQAADVSTLFQQVIREFRDLGRPLSIPEGADFGQISRAILDRFCEPGRRLLILDNLEDLFSDPDRGDTLDGRLVDFLGQLPVERCKVILTSRTDFRNLPRGYRRVGLNPLEGLEIGEFFQELLRDRAGVVDMEELRVVLSRTGAHPITLLLALALLEEGVSLQEVLGRLTDPSEEPWRYLVEKTLERMGPEESEIYRALSLFRSTGTVATLSEVIGIGGSEIRQALHRLFRFSLVTKQTHVLLDEEDYGLLPLLREDAGRKRMADPERESEMKQRFGQWVLGEIDEYGSRLDALGMLELNRLDQEKWNILVGGVYLQELSRGDDALKVYDCCMRIDRLFEHREMESAVLNNMGIVYLRQGDWDRALEMYGKSLEIRERLGDHHGMAQTLGNIGNVYRVKGDWDGALEMYGKSLETFERLGDHHGMAQTFNNMGVIYDQQAEWDQALEIYGKALETFERLGDHHGMAQTLGNIGNVYRDKGEWDRALEMHGKSLEIDERLGDHHGMAQTFNNMGMVLADKGEWDRALEMYGKSLEIDERLGDHHGMAQTFNNMGMVLADKGEWNRALEMYGKSLETYERLGDYHGMAQTFNNMGVIYYQQGEWDGALEMYGKSLEISERLGDHHGMAATLNNMGNVYRQQGEWDRGMEMFGKSVEIKERLGDHHGMAQTFGNMGIVYYQKGDWDQALEMYGKALEISERLGDLHGVAQTRFNMALLSGQKGDLKGAVTLASQALEIFKKYGSTHIQKAEDAIRRWQSRK